MLGEPHIDKNDLGYNVVVPWGDWQGGRLVLHSVGVVVDIRPGDGFIFASSLLVHGVEELEGERSVVDIFTCRNLVGYAKKGK